MKEKPRPPIELQPALDSGLNAIILKAIAKSPTDRYESAAEFREAIATLRGAALNHDLVAGGDRADINRDGDEDRWRGGSWRPPGPS